MALKNLDLWLPELRSRVSAASDDLLLQQLKAAVRPFAKETGAYVVHILNQKTVTGRARYYLTPQPEGEVFIIHQIWYDGAPVAMQMTPDKGATSSTSGNPNKVVLESRGVFSFVPTPLEGKDNIWDADVSVIPKNSNYVPDDWYTVWFDEILNGALSNIYSMPKRPWSSNTQAAFHGRKFRIGISAVRDAVRKKYSVKDVSCGFPNWAGA